MQVIPITSPSDYDKNYTLELTPEMLSLYAKDQDMPELLSFIPNIDVEHTSVQGTELCTHIMYANLRRIFRLPTLGAIDQKQKYSSIYASSRNMRPFFKGAGLKMINFRIVAEVMLLYGLSIGDIKLMTEKCCSFSLEPDGSVVSGPDIEALSNLYSKKQIAKIIKDIPGVSNLTFFPNYIIRGIEYISYEDFLHTFRAIGQDPYKVFHMFATRNLTALSKLNIIAECPEEFDIVPFETAIKPKGIPAEKESSVPVSTLAPEMPNEPGPKQDAVSAAPCQGGESKTNDVQTPRVTFGTIIMKALEPLAEKMPLHVLKNIYILREGCGDHKNMQDRDFDALFVASNPSNLDILNRLSRISYLYSVPMYDLLFTELPFDKYKPTNQMRPATYSIKQVSDQLDQRPVTVQSLFKIMAKFPLKRVNVFGYMPPVPAKDKNPVYTNQSAANPQPADANQKGCKEDDKPMEVSLKLRVCIPCDADSWENDNPDRTAPGFHWETGSEDLCDSSKTALIDALKKSAMRPSEVRDCIAEIVKVPFKAQVVITEPGSRMAIDIF